MEVQDDVFVPAASHRPFTCHLCNVLAFKPVKVKLFVLVVSNIHVEEEFSLYLTL